MPTAKKKPVAKKGKTAKVQLAKPISKKQQYIAIAKKLGIWLGIPLLFYFVFFCLFAGTWIGHFNTRLFADQGDGFQSVWDFWWVNYSVTHLHQLPWHTTMLHYPYGTTLVGQTLNPFNGFMGIGLLKIFSLIQAFNIMVIFSFVFGGVTAFWLCNFVTKKYIPSLIGGFIFTFSSYHFAHAIGHMQLVSLEWIPLFILLWWKLLLKPRYLTAIGASLVLMLVLLCDYYYFIYCVVSTVFIFIYLAFKKQLPSFKDRRVYMPLAVFVILTALTSGPLPLHLLRDNSRDPFLGGHNDRLFSTDALSTVIDGGFWHFASITHFYWRHVKAYIAESSVYFGISTIVLLVIAFWKRNKLNKQTVFWIGLGLAFLIFSLGPRLMAVGHSINSAPMPYALLEKVFPQLKLSGDPDRIIVMAFLAAAVLAAIVLSHLDLKKRKHQLILASFFIVYCLEVWPAALPVNIPTAPKYVSALAKLPYDGVLDNGAVSASWQLYDQTITAKPIALGYISRTPTTVDAKDQQLVNNVNPDGYAKLCSTYHIRYLTLPTSRPLDAPYPILYQDKNTFIYDLGKGHSC